MDKTILNKFISKYFLNGNVESVIWKSNGSLSVKFVDDTKSLVGEVSCKEANFPEAEFGINQTSKLKSLLSVLGDKVDVNIESKDGKSALMAIFDDNVNINYVLADPTIIPKVPNLKAMPSWDLTLNLDTKFMDNFIKASAALSDVKEFAVITNKKKVKFVIGHSNVKTTNIVVNVDAEEFKDMSVVYFSTIHLREILSANKEAKTATMEVSEKGLAYLSFDVDGFKTSYFMVSRQDINA